MKFVGLGLTLFLNLFTLFLSAQAQDTDLEQAEASYFAGEQATTIADRTQDFQHALQLYLGIERDHKKELAYGDGQLYYNIGNSYFQLGELPWAILYYYRTLEFSPRDHRARQNLEIARTKLGLTPPPPPSWFARTLGLQTLLSLPEKLQTFFHLGVALLMLLSAYLWMQSRWIKRAIYLFSAALLFVLLSIGYTLYFSSLEGVLVEPSVLYRDAGTQYAVVSNQPILAGEKVYILDVRQEGQWLKVLTDQDVIGFLPYKAVRLIRP